MKCLVILLTFLQAIYFSDFISYKEYKDSCWQDWTEWEFNIAKISITKDSITINDSIYYINAIEKDSVIRFITNKGVLRLRKDQLYIDLPTKIICYGNLHQIHF